MHCEFARLQKVYDNLDNGQNDTLFELSAAVGTKREIYCRGKLLKGNVFTGVCQSVHGGGGRYTQGNRYTYPQCTDI